MVPEPIQSGMKQTRFMKNKPSQLTASAGNPVAAKQY
jgi:hypothetical protein